MILFCAACSDRYEQHYDNFAAWDKVNGRNKSWFPHIISTDAFDLKSDSYLDPLCAFGTFKYSNDNYYDSIFSGSIAKQIDIETFNTKVKTHSDRRPAWFLDPELTSKKNWEAINLERFYIARDIAHKSIYFVLSN